MDNHTAFAIYLAILSLVLILIMSVSYLSSQSSKVEPEGKSTYDTFVSIPDNENKTFEEFSSSLRSQEHIEKDMEPAYVVEKPVKKVAHEGLSLKFLTYNPDLLITE